MSTQKTKEQILKELYQDPRYKEAIKNLSDDDKKKIDVQLEQFVESFSTKVISALDAIKNDPEKVKKVQEELIKKYGKNST